MKISTVIFFLTVTLCLSSLALAKSEDGLTASGYLTVTSFGGSGKVISQWSSTNYFQVSISSGGQYLIKVHPLNEEGDTFYLTYDGTDTFFVRYREATVDVNQKIIDRESIEKKVNPAYISSGNYPFVPWDEQKRAHILWLVFGAGEYLHNSGTNTMLLPWIPARWSLLSYGFHVEDKLSAELPYIPKELQFVRDYKLDLASDSLEMERPELDSPSGDPWIKKWKSELQERRKNWTNGFVAGKLESGDFTNQNGLSIPLSFSFQAFHPQWVHKLRWKYDGIVTNVTSLTSGESFQPPIISVVGAEDSRFRFRDANKSLDGVNYPVTATNSWPPHDSLDKQKLLQAGLASREVSARFVYGDVRNKRIIIITMVMIFALSLPVFLFLNATRKIKK